MSRTNSQRLAFLTLSFVFSFLPFFLLSPKAVLAQSSWKDEWEKTLRAAEHEGRLNLYGCCYEYDRILEGFKKRYPKIKVTTVLGPGSQLGSRILAERRGEKYVADVFSAGANTIHDVLYKARGLEPIKPALIFPEVLDLSKWYEGKHRYIDPEKRYIFAFVANSQSGQVSYHIQQVHQSDFKSYWDLLNPKWKRKMASLDPTTFGMGAALQFFHYHPELGPAGRVEDLRQPDFQTTTPGYPRKSMHAATSSGQRGRLQPGALSYPSPGMRVA